MKLTYRIDAGQLTQCEEAAAQVLIYCQPTHGDKTELKEIFSLDPIDLESINDPDEVPRLENTDEGTFMIWKRPDNVSGGDTLLFQVSSLGIAIVKDKVAFIMPVGDLPMTGREFKHINSLWDCVLHVLLHTVRHYQGHLKAIKMMSQQLQAKIVSSMENKFLLQMFALGESLVYYYNALEANLSVLTKLRHAPGRLKFTDEQIEFLDDVIIENQQACKQASIYSTTLSGLMDARGTIINNNMTVLLRNLTLINIVFLPLNLLASIGGMSEYTMMTGGIDWRIAYGAFAAAMIALGLATWWILVRVIDRHPRHNGLGDTPK